MKKPLSYSLLCLCVVLTYSQIAHAERLTLEGTTLSFERPNELFQPCRSTALKKFLCIAEANKFPHDQPDCETCDQSVVPFVVLMELVSIDGPWKTVEEYVAVATKGAKNLIASREESIAGLRAVEVATEGPGARTHWTPERRVVNHMYVFMYRDQIYICHLLSSVEVYRSVVAEFQSFCKSIRAE